MEIYLEVCPKCSAALIDGAVCPNCDPGGAAVQRNASAPAENDVASTPEVACPECGELCGTKLVRCWNCAAFLTKESADHHKELISKTDRQDTPDPDIQLQWAESDAPAENTDAVETVNSTESASNAAETSASQTPTMIVCPQCGESCGSKMIRCWSCSSFLSTPPPNATAQTRRDAPSRPRSPSIPVSPPAPPEPPSDDDGFELGDGVAFRE